MIVLHDINLALVLQRQAQRQRDAARGRELPVERAVAAGVTGTLSNRIAGAAPRLFSVSMWVIAPISTSQLAPSTLRNSPIFSTCSSQPRSPRYCTRCLEIVSAPARDM